MCMWMCLYTCNSEWMTMSECGLLLICMNTCVTYGFNIFQKFIHSNSFVSFFACTFFNGVCTLSLFLYRVLKTKLHWNTYQNIAHKMLLFPVNRQVYHTLNIQPLKRVNWNMKVICFIGVRATSCVVHVLDTIELTSAKRNMDILILWFQLLKVLWMWFGMAKNS